MLLSPTQTAGMYKAGVLSPRDQCRSFDASADGYCRAEGVNMIYIKRLDDALRDGNPIRAIIRGTATNADGKGEGLFAPSAVGHEALIRSCYESAGIEDLGRTAHFECHGTGTKAGDPTETTAVANVFGEHGGISIGSSKVRNSPTRQKEMKRKRHALRLREWTAALIRPDSSQTLVIPKVPPVSPQSSRACWPSKGKPCCQISTLRIRTPAVSSLIFSSSRGLLESGLPKFQPADDSSHSSPMGARPACACGCDPLAQGPCRTHQYQRIWIGRQQCPCNSRLGPVIWCGHICSGQDN